MKRLLLHSLSEKGFTVVELIITMGVISILMGLAITSFGTVQKRGRDAKRASDTEQIRQALEFYRSDNAFYPSATAGSVTNLNATLVPTYMPFIPADPLFTNENYYFRPTNLTNGQYYGYCVCSRREVQTGTVNTCTNLTPAVTPPANYNNCSRSP